MRIKTLSVILAGLLGSANVTSTEAYTLQDSAAAPESYSIADVMSAPFANPPVAAKAADRFAWVVEERGMRNIYTSVGPNYRTEKVTDYGVDDGQVISNLSLSDDGAQILYVRGGAPNRFGEIPNPDSNPDGVSRDIWLLNTYGGEPRKVATGSSPSFTPDGHSILFKKGRDLYTIATTEGAEAKRLFTMRGSASQWVWSPDGRQLAFVSNRGTHSFVGVYTPADNSLKWMAPNVERDTLPAWSPDGSKLAFIRLPGYAFNQHVYLMANEKFNLMVADVASGKAESWFSADNAHGYFASGNGLPLTWSADGELVFQSEHKGFLRFYKMRYPGERPTELMTGRCEIETASITADKRDILVSNNCGDIQRRDVWRITIRNGQRSNLTDTPMAVESNPVSSASGQTIAYRQSTASIPQAIYLMDKDGKNKRTARENALPASFPQDKMVTPSVVTLTAIDGVKTYGTIFMPKNIPAGEKAPALIFTHGGPIRQMMPAFHNRGYYSNAYAMNQYLASQGYVVMSLNYRAGIGYGRDFRTFPTQGPRGSAELQDLIAAGKYLAEMPEVDASNIGLWGGSYGGVMTGLGLSRAPDMFKTGVAFHGVFDWSARSFHLNGKEGTGAWNIFGPEAQKLAFDSSTVGDLSKWKAPILLIHGDDDRNVVFQQSIDFTRRLEAKNIKVENLVFPDEVHGFLLHRSWVSAYEATKGWFDRYLK